MNPNVLVVDSNIAVKWYIAEEYSERSRSILDDYLAGILELLAPDLIYSEFGNIVWKKQVFQGLSETDAYAAVEAFCVLPVRITPAVDLLVDAYRLAVTYKRSVYDSLYLALSLRENCRFVTADEKFVAALGGAFPNAVLLADW